MECANRLRSIQYINEIDLIHTKCSFKWGVDDGYGFRVFRKVVDIRICKPTDLNQESALDIFYSVSATMPSSKSATAQRLGRR